MKKMKKIFCLIFFLYVISSAAYAAEKAIPVSQPAYNSMNFYVYKPVNLPKEFYVTFDGYLVYTDSKGVWHYGSAEKNGIIKTGYVVGSVIPSVVMLKPYDAKISSLAPVLGSNKTVEPAKKKITPSATKNENEKLKSNTIVYMPPASRFEMYTPVVLSPNATDWTQNSNFMAIGKWQKVIEYIGVLDKPRVPIAWKGEYPDIIYAWNGLHWRQILSKGKNISAMSTLRREIYNLTVNTRKVNILRWTEDDTHVLSQYSAMWGYKWLGQIIVRGNIYEY